MRPVWLALVLVLLGGCQRPAPPSSEPPAPPSPEPPVATMIPLPELATAFAVESRQSAPVTAALSNQRPATGLANLANTAKFGFLSSAQRTAIARDGILAVPVDDDTLDSVYRRNLRDGVPSYVTAEAVVLLLDDVLDQTYAELVDKAFGPLLTNLTLALIDRTRAQLGSAASPEVRDAARANLAYLLVAAGLLGLSVDADESARRLAEGELPRLLAGEPARADSVIPGEVDAAQLRVALDGPATPARRAARALAWYALPLETAERVGGQPRSIAPRLRRILLLADALAAEPGAPMPTWRAVCDTQNWLLGGPDDAGPGDALIAAHEIYGPARTARDYDDPDRLEQFAQSLWQRAPSTRMALLPRPADLDGTWLERLAQTTGPRTAGGLELFAARGDESAAALVDDALRRGGDPPAFRRVSEELRAQAQSRGFDWAPRELGVATAKFLAEPLAGRGPWYVGTPAWRERALLGGLAVWAARRLPATPDSADRAEFPTAATGAPLAFCDPVPRLYLYLQQLARATSRGLRAHELLSDRLEATWQACDDLLGFLATASSEWLRGRPLEASARQRLSQFGLESAWILGGAAPELARLGPAGKRLRHGLGPVLVLYVVVPDGDRLLLARGALPGYWESTSEAGPATPEAWRAALRGGTAPSLPAWATFIQPNPRLPWLPAAGAAPP